MYMYMSIYICIYICFTATGLPDQVQVQACSTDCLYCFLIADRIGSDRVGPDRTGPDRIRSDPRSESSKDSPSNTPGLEPGRAAQSL